MSDGQNGEREHWSSALGFILAAVGSAVGLGNIWRFPYITGENGGGAFVLIYLGCVAVVGLPLLTAEMKIGRRTESAPVGAYRALARERTGGEWWKVFGFFAVATGFVLLSYYSVVGGWTLGFAWKALSGELMANPDQAFGSLTGSASQSLLYHGLFMAIAIGIVSGGVTDGIERAARILMPAFGAMLFGLLIYALTLDSTGQTFSYLFVPNWSRVGLQSVLTALGQGLFTLSLGMGAIIVYGSYLSEEEDLYQSSLMVAVFNTLVSLVAAVVMFSIIFSQGGEPAKGPGLAFVTIPKLFAQLPGGTILAVVFFLLLAFAAITSAISLLEVVVSYFVEELDYDRGVAVVAFGGLIFVLGVPSALGFNIWSDVTFQVGGGDAKNILGTIDHFVANYALALGALGTALYAGWAVEEREWRDEIAEGPMKDLLFAGWLWLVRLIGPTAVVLVILSKLGLI